MTDEQVQGLLEELADQLDTLSSSYDHHQLAAILRNLGSLLTHPHRGEGILEAIKTATDA